MRGWGPRRHSFPLFLTIFSACAATLPARTIEPPAQTEAAPAGPPRSEDSHFVRSREGHTVAAIEYGPVHVGELWWSFRADHLKLSLAESQARDAALSESEGPADFWDEQTAGETVAIWGTLCNECHGGRRRPQDVTEMPKPAPAWGRGEGLFFGNRRPYAEIFWTVSNGGPVRNGQRSRMPPWRGKLAKEQIWALIYFLEYQSGGIEGRFPPSLYPRGVPATGTP